MAFPSDLAPSYAKGIPVTVLQHTQWVLYAEINKNLGVYVWFGAGRSQTATTGLSLVLTDLNQISPFNVRQ
jgi:hypothetical protein